MNIKFLKNLFTKSNYNKKNMSEYINKSEHTINMALIQEKKSDILEHKKNILLIDDNRGILSILEDDIKVILEELGEDCNIISFCGKTCGIDAIDFLTLNPDISIDYAILDIVYGGLIYNNNKNKMINITGLDVFRKIFTKSGKINILFFTGNTLNNYITQNIKFIEEFKRITNKNIEDYLIYKTMHTMDERRNIIKRKMFLCS